MASNDANDVTITDWTMCCLCQKVSREKLSNPFMSASNLVERHVDCVSYKSLDTNIPIFHKLDKMPISFNPHRLDDGGGYS